MLGTLNSATTSPSVSITQTAVVAIETSKPAYNSIAVIPVHCSKPQLALRVGLDANQPDDRIFEVELLNTFVIDSVATGEERTIHEFAVAYAPFSFWKTAIAFEMANVADEGFEFEAVELENVFLLYSGHGHDDHGHDHDHGHGSFFELGALGFYLGAEIPREGGISNGGIEFGPIAEFSFGPVETVANLIVEVPFEDNVDPGLGYALSMAVPVFESDAVELAAGFEAHGGVEEVFGNGTPLGQNSHVVGPAIYTEFDVGNGRSIEPRLAVLFGMTDASPDAVASFNIELKY